MIVHQKPQVKSVSFNLLKTKESKGFSIFIRGIRVTLMPGGGVLSEKVGTGMCGPDRVLFRALRFCNGPFFI